MHWVQLSQRYRATLLFTTKSPERLSLNITLMLLVLVRWSQYYSDSHCTKKVFHLITPSARGYFHVFWGPFCVAVCFYVLRNCQYLLKIHIYTELYAIVYRH